MTQQEKDLEADALPKIVYIPSPPEPAEAKKPIPSLTKAFNTVSGITYVSDPPNLNKVPMPDLTMADVARALFPPEPTKEDSIGIIVHDYFVANWFGALDRNTPQTQAWVKREENQFQEYISDVPESKKKAHDFIENIIKFDDSEEIKPSEIGGSFFRFNFKENDRNPPLEVSDSKEGPWRKLIDPKALSPDGSTFIRPGISISEDGKRVLYFLSKFGQDEGNLHILDVDTGEVLQDTGYFGSQPPSMIWDPNTSDSFTYTAPSGALVRHEIGKMDGDEVVFQPPKGSYSMPLYFGPSKYEWANAGVGTDRMFGVYCRPKGSKEPFKELVKPQQYDLKPLLEKEDGSIIAITTEGAIRGRLVSFKPGETPDKWQTIIPEDPNDVLRLAFFSKKNMVVGYSHDAASAAKIFTLDGKFVADAPFEVQSTVQFTSERHKKKGDSPFVTESGVLPVIISSFKRTGDKYDFNIDTNTLTLTKKSKSKSDLSDCIVERLYAKSKDGTTVPMTVVRAPGTKLDGTAAVKLYGYGSFGERLFPELNPEVEQFVRAGGIYAQANIRGGGEFGEEWHNAGRLKNKQNSFDDFIACAEKLVDDKYTSTSRLVIEGGSAGGLLTSGCAVQRPDLFGAVIIDKPVTDMIGWRAVRVPEYGDPINVREDFNVAAQYSPVQNIKKGAKYPAQLVIVGDHDDRVPAEQSYKYVATMQAETDPSNIVMLHVEKGASHTASEDPATRKGEVFAFIEKAIGPVNQEDYKKQLTKKAAVAANANKAKKAAGSQNRIGA